MAAVLPIGLIIKVTLLVSLVISGRAQDPRKRENPLLQFQNSLLKDADDLESDDVSCTSKSCIKRSSGQDEFGPFWANRGKKDPSYYQDKLFVDEPHWFLVRRAENAHQKEPFYVTRGKKRSDNEIDDNNEDFVAGARNNINRLTTEDAAGDFWNNRRARREVKTTTKRRHNGKMVMIKHS